MRRQHSEIRDKLDWLGETLRRTTDIEDLMTELLALLCSHEEAEENHLIPVIEETLTDSERRALARELRGL